MPTISKISMSGYTPISNRKSNQKASNPISANAQDSSSLNMSPNAHYGRHAVSFKARFTPQDAEKFLNTYHPLANTPVDKLSRNALASARRRITLKVNNLLHIIAEPNCAHLKDQALGHLSDLVNHNNDMFRCFTLKNISEVIFKKQALAVPELFDHIIPRIKDKDFQVREKALNALDKCLESVDHKSRDERLPKLFDDHIIPSLGDTEHSVRLMALELAGKYAPLVAPESRHKSLPEVFSKYIISLLDNKEDCSIFAPSQSGYNDSRKLQLLEPLNQYAKYNSAIVTPELTPKLLKTLETLQQGEFTPDDVKKAASSLHRTLLAPREIREMKKVLIAKSILAAEGEKFKPELPMLKADPIKHIASFVHLDGPSIIAEDPNLILAQRKSQSKND